MKDLTKIYIDLSKCSEEQRKSLPQILEKADQEVYFLAKPPLLSGKLDTYYPYLVFSRPSSNVWVFSHNKPDRTELTYPEFIKLFEGGEGEKTDSIITDRAIDLVFQNTSFGENPNYRQILRDGIEKVKEGYANGRTVSLCLLELGLVEHSNEYSVTKIGEVFFAEPLNSNQ